ncbi:MAG: ABC transporter permease subunit [Alphaproteobacteria bacterium]|nr:ABC transporter permease subunit [Alphaproteobacteria bacterium]
MVKKLLKLSYMLFVTAVLYMPLLVVLVISFNEKSLDVSNLGLKEFHFTPKWYISLFENKDLIYSAFRSVCLAVSSATISTIVGTVIAIALHRYRFIGQKLVYGSLSVIMMTPEIIIGISLAMTFIIIGIKMGFWSLLLAHTVLCFPYVTITVLSRLRSFNRSLAEAAADLGASDIGIAKNILLPLIIPAMFAGWLMSFTLSLDDVIVSFFVSSDKYEILPMKIYSMVQTGIQPDVNALCSVMFFITFMVVVSAYRMVRSKPN